MCLVWSIAIELFSSAFYPQVLTVLQHRSLPEPKMLDHDLVVVIQLPNGRTNAHWRYRELQLELLFQQFVVETIM